MSAMPTVIILVICTVTLPLSAAINGFVDINLIRDKCFYRSIPQIIRCQLTFSDNVYKSCGQRALHVNTSQITDSQLRSVCCGLWDMTSCMKSAIVKYSHCKPQLVRKFTKDIEDLGHEHDFKVCGHRYKEGSIHCGFPVWATITLIVITVILVAVVTCCVHRWCSARSRISRESIRLVEPSLSGA